MMCLQGSVLLGSVATRRLLRLPVSRKPPGALICAAPFASQPDSTQGMGIALDNAPRKLTDENPDKPRTDLEKPWTAIASKPLEGVRLHASPHICVGRRRLQPRSS